MEKHEDDRYREASGKKQLVNAFKRSFADKMVLWTKHHPNRHHECLGLRRWNWLLALHVSMVLTMVPSQVKMPCRASQCQNMLWHINRFQKIMKRSLQKDSICQWLDDLLRLKYVTDTVTGCHTKRTSSRCLVQNHFWKQTLSAP